MSITTTLTLTEINKLIQDVTKAEKITKEGLSALSRELLAHAYQHGDIAPINTLMGVDSNGKFRLTPLNWRTAAMYFNNFVAFTSNYDKDVKAYANKGEGKRKPLVFNKKSKAKYTRLLPTVEQWLADSDNDIWSWSDDNVTMQDKPVDLLALAVKAVVKAMNDEENGGFTMGDIIAQVQEEEDVTVNLERSVEADAAQQLTQSPYYRGFYDNYYKELTLVIALKPFQYLKYQEGFVEITYNKD